MQFSIDVDINECVDGEFPCHENADCTNTDGSYSCMCKEGYAGDGMDCNGECHVSSMECTVLIFCIHACFQYSVYLVYSVTG